jgi:hypothetical protein
MNHPKDKGKRYTYEVGYGKPPTKGRFAKGQSGNPRGRPKKSSPSLVIDPSIRDRFLKMAKTLVQSREGDKLPLCDAVWRSEAAAALKGNPQAQKHHLDRVERFTADWMTEIRENHEFWHNYISEYKKLEEAGQVLPQEYPHPDDLIFPSDDHVMIRGGAPTEAAWSRQYLIRLRDLWWLQAEMDRRNWGPRSSLRVRPILTSEVVALLINQTLPSRLQLNDANFLQLTSDYMGLKKRELEQRLKIAWRDFGFRNAPACNPSATARTRSTASTSAAMRQATASVRVTSNK